MARRLLLLTVLLVVVLPGASRAEVALPGAGPTICGPQDYDSPDPPDFHCPGPEEAALAPELHPPPAVSVHQGWRVVDGEGETVFVVQWDGALVHRDRLVELGLKLYSVRRLRWADRLRLRSEYDIRLQHAEEVRAARVGFLEEQRDGYEERWRASERRTDSARAWYRSWWFGAIVGVVGTGALVALTAYALHSVGGT